MIGRVCACAELRPSLRVLILLLWRRRACRRPRSTASTACAMARSVSPRTLPLLHCAVVLLRSLLTTFRMHTGCQGKLEDARAHSQEVNRRQSGPAAAEVLNFKAPAFCSSSWHLRAEGGGGKRVFDFFEDSPRSSLDLPRPPLSSYLSSMLSIASPP